MSVLIIFGSLLGRTKRIAVLLGMHLQAAGFEVKVKDIRDTDINELDYPDLTIMACSTWDDGMLQVDFRPFQKDLMKSKLKGKKFAVLGLGGHKYPHFCTAPDILSAAAKQAGGEVIIENLKLDLDHNEAMDKCDDQVREWGDKIIKQFNNAIMR